MAEQTQARVRSKLELREPKMFAVVVHNDDITTMDFVVEVLVKVFRKTTAEGAQIMMNVHERGKGVAGVYTYDIAVTKKFQADMMSREYNFPLKLTVDEAAGL
ncbi:MAG: ATP-dependent Clp protease adaptor ClpS [Clostridiales bacterium]|jgi:ATP-dependent Clp protease adaptor protein ClpS|nr:ATP-dependent Clp protease adaptor ClpS [Clostridiales bacterium]